MKYGASRWRLSLAVATAWLALWTLLAAASGCATNPYTQRWQFLILSQSYEQDLGAQAYQQVLQDPKGGNKGVRPLKFAVHSCRGPSRFPLHRPQ